MMKFMLAALAGVLLCGAAAQSKTYTPRPGTPERVALMNAIRTGTHSTSLFMVDYLRVADTYGIKIAYAEVHPANDQANLPFAGWVLLRRDEGAWRVLWGVSDSGISKCSAQSSTYLYTIRFFQISEASPQFLSERFWHDSIMPTQDNTDGYCKGTPI